MLSSLSLSLLSFYLLPLSCHHDLQNFAKRKSEKNHSHRWKNRKKNFFFSFLDEWIWSMVKMWKILTRTCDSRVKNFFYEQSWYNCYDYIVWAWLILLLSCLTNWIKIIKCNGLGIDVVTVCHHEKCFLHPWIEQKIGNISQGQFHTIHWNPLRSWTESNLITHTKISCKYLPWNCLFNC